MTPWLKRIHDNLLCIQANLLVRKGVQVDLFKVFVVSVVAVQLPLCIAQVINRYFHGQIELTRKGYQGLISVTLKPDLQSHDKT